MDKTIGHVCEIILDEGKPFTRHLGEDDRHSLKKALKGSLDDTVFGTGVKVGNAAGMVKGSLLTAGVLLAFSFAKHLVRNICKIGSLFNRKKKNPDKEQTRKIPVLKASSSAQMEAACQLLRKEGIKEVSVKAVTGKNGKTEYRIPVDLPGKKYREVKARYEKACARMEKEENSGKK